MSEPTTAWNPLLWLVTFGGIQLQGFGPGDFMTITPPDATFKAVIGARGEVCVAYNPDTHHVVKMSFLRPSSANRLLYKAFGTQRDNAESGTPFGAVLTISNKAVVGDQWRSDEAYLLAKPEEKMSGEVPVTEWSIGGRMDITPDGASTAPDPLAFMDGV